MQIEVTATATPEAREAVLAGLVAFNDAQADMNIAPLTVLARADSGVIVGGLIGRTVAAWLYIELLWVSEALRGAGTGAEMMRQAESEAMRRGCLGAHLNTYSFQAPGFYRRLGYEAFGSIENHPPGHTRIWLRKRFDNPPAAASPAAG